jgi:hypothetical protein
MYNCHSSLDPKSSDNTSIFAHAGGPLMAPWVYDENFLAGIRFLFGTLPFTAVKDDDLEYPAQE